MTSTASHAIIDQDWIVAVPVAPQVQPQTPQLPAPQPDVRQPIAAEVLARARELYQPPHYITAQEREGIAAELSAWTSEQRRQLRQRLHICEYAQAGMCTPSRARLTG